MDLSIAEIGSLPGTAIVGFPVDNLDAGNVKDFRAAIQAVADTHDIVMLDMQRLNFVDSSGLGALISCLRHVRGNHGDMKLCSMSEPVRALFELTRMHRVFNIIETRDEAVRSFA